jgi:hypothetical protein
MLKPRFEGRAIDAGKTFVGINLPVERMRRVSTAILGEHQPRANRSDLVVT